MSSYQSQIQRLILFQRQLLDRMNTDLIFLQDPCSSPSSWWINNARMLWSCGPGLACEKACICLFSDIHNPKGIRHQRPVNEKAFSDIQSLRSWIHLNQLGEKSFWHQGILQGRLIMITKDVLRAAASCTSKVFSLNQH